MATVVTAPEADRQLEAIDDWWRANRPAAPEHQWQSMSRFSCRDDDVLVLSRGEISEVLAKVMAVAAGQKRLQVQEVVDRHGIDLESYE